MGKATTLLAKLSALKDTYSGVAGKTGGVLQLAEEFKAPEILATGFPELDNKVLVIGGIPKGRVTELAGETGAGKSTLACNIMANAIAAGMACVYADKEDTMTAEYAEKIGCPKDSFLLFKGHGLSGPDYLERLMLQMESGAELIILDSLAFIASDDLSDTELADVTMKTNMSTPMLTKAFIQKLYSGWAPKTDHWKEVAGKTGKVSITDTGTTLIVINHLKTKLGPQYGKPDKDSGGGDSIKFAYSIRFAMERYGMARDKSLQDEDGNPIYTRTKITVVKNKLAPGGRSTMMFVDNRTGRFFSDQEAILKFAIQMNIVLKKGAWYYWHDGFKTDAKLHKALGLKDFNPDMKEQGKDKVLEYINTNSGLLAHVLGVRLNK